MGADIHIFLERKTDSNSYDGPSDKIEQRDERISQIINGRQKERWVSADSWFFREGQWYNQSFFGFRNYYMFSVLADVRNSGNIDPISEPKGIPEDASSGYLYMTKRWDGDAHSHSYFTLAELRSINWDEYDKSRLSELLDAMDRMEKMADDPEKIRICFFFDN